MPSAAIPTVSTGHRLLTGSLRRVAGLCAALRGKCREWTEAWFREPPRASQDSARATRMQREELLAMSAHELSDLGIGRSEAPALLNRPDAWRSSRH